MEYVIKSGPWSFDRVLLVLNHISGEEQPSDLNMHFGIFRTRIYELLLILICKTMSRKIGNIIGSFEEMDLKEAYRNGQFLRIKVTIHMKNPLKRGTLVKFKENNL